MRNLVQPAPASHCVFCGGELRLKAVEPYGPVVEPHGQLFELDTEIFVCLMCAREQAYVVSHDRYAALPTRNMWHADLG
jgi:hypothetical protein